MATLFYISIYNKNFKILELSYDCININYLFDFRKHNNEKKNLKQRLHSQSSNWLIRTRHYIQLVKKHNFSLQSYIAIIADADEDFAFIVSSKRTQGFQSMLDHNIYWRNFYSNINMQFRLAHHIAALASRREDFYYITLNVRYEILYCQ